MIAEVELYVNTVKPAGKWRQPSSLAQQLCSRYCARRGTIPPDPFDKKTNFSMSNDMFSDIEAGTAKEFTGERGCSTSVLA